MTNRIGFKADLDDNVSSRLDKIRDKFNTIGGKGTAASLFGNVGAMAAGAALGIVSQAAGQVIDVLGRANEAALAEDESLARLDTSLRANVKSFRGNTTAIEETLRARMKLGFSDDEQRESLSLLLVATKDDTKALAHQRAAMDLARLKKISLGDATSALIKIEGGQFRALKALGIELPKNATQTEALAAVQKAAAGQAEAYAETYRGKLLVSNVKVDESLEKLGGKTMPLVVAATEHAASVVESMAGSLDILSGKMPESTAAAMDLQESISRILPGPFGDMLRKEVDKGRAALTDLDKGTKAVVTGLAAKNQEYKAAADRFADNLPDEMDEARKEAIRVSRRTPQDIANALRDKRAAWQQAIDQLADDLKNKMSGAAEVAKIKAALAGSNIAKGLKSKDPVVKAQAEATRKILVDRLIGMGGAARRYGQQFTQNLARGIRDKLGTLVAALRLLAAKQAAYLEYASPAKEGPGSKGGGPEGWARRMVELYAKGMDPSVIASRASAIAGASVPGRFSGGGFGGVASAGGARGGVVIHVTYAPTVGLGSPAEMQAAASALVPALSRELVRQRVF